MKLITLILFSLSLQAHAEYRVYQYIVKNKIKSSDKDKASSLQISTLNPVAYTAYNGGRSIIDVDLLRTWVCPGRTANFKKLCPSPYARLTLEELE